MVETRARRAKKAGSPARRKDSPARKSTSKSTPARKSTPASKSTPKSNTPKNKSGRVSREDSSSQSDEDNVTAGRTTEEPTTQQEPDDTCQGKPSTEKETFDYEFGGPIGAFFIIIGLPVVIYGLFIACNQDYCMNSIYNFDWDVFVNKIPAPEAFISDEACAMFTGWMVFHFVLERILPGEVAYGVTLANDKKLAYVLSGHLQFWVTLVVIGYSMVELTDVDEETNEAPGIVAFRPLPLHIIYDHYLPLITASIAWSLALSVYLYASSFQTGALLAAGGDSGNALYDFFIGRELNPRIGDFDLKVFCELRPGLIGWAVINIGMACKQYQMNGFISLSMLLINLFQGFYVWDALYSERAILTTMDVTTDGFGFMLAFGDLAWVPFIYSLQSRYLVDYDPDLALWKLAIIVALQCGGYYLFRAANSQKDTFRRNPSDPAVSHLTYMQTQRGTKLLTSGWWGLARKINYTGDWIMTLSWCLLCGFDSPIPYFQAVYFLVLLVHRAMRDDKLCQEKYGNDWTEYKRRVPYLFIPYVI